MSLLYDPFTVVLADETAEDFDSLQRRPASLESAPLSGHSNVEVGQLSGFDLDDQPLLSGIESLRGEIVRGRSTVPLRRAHVGAHVVLVFERGDRRRPIVIGILQDCSVPGSDAPNQPDPVEIVADRDRLVVSAEREISLRCGKASITLTRAGKVVITGSYIVSRSTGYNRIKGAAVDIN